VKNGALLQELRKIAKAKDLTLMLLRHGSNHDLYEMGSVRLTVPRHAEINEITAKGIIREAERA
jgi:mRNA interferase HicA